MIQKKASIIAAYRALIVNSGRVKWYPGQGYHTKSARVLPHLRQDTSPRAPAGAARAAVRMPCFPDRTASLISGYSSA